MNGDICLFLLTQVFLIIHQTKLVTPLAKFLLESNFLSEYQVIKKTYIHNISNISKSFLFVLGRSRN